MIRRIVCVVVMGAAIVLPAQTSAQDRSAKDFSFGGDSFLAGARAISASEVSGDLFAAGARVGIDAPVAGAAHVAGRRVAVDAGVAGDLYAIGYNVDIRAPVGGSASVAGAEVALTAPVSRNLRAVGSDITLAAAVGGSALLSGGRVTIDGPVSGDLSIAVDTLSFGRDAMVGGLLQIVTNDPSEVEVPERVADPSRVTVTQGEQRELDVSEEVQKMGRQTVFSVLRHLLLSVLVAVVLTALAVALAPDFVARTRRAALARPARSILLGFVTLSALVGAGIVLALTLIGLLLTPLAFVLAVLSVFAGWIAGAYILGVGLWQATGRAVPADPLRRAGLAAFGALVAGIVALIPVIGWIAWLILVLLGLGGIASAIWRRDSGMAPAG